nr:DUF5979 domain-containing protein [Candidatus Nanopelagicales bacterium]
MFSKFRKALAGVTSTAVIGGLVTVGAVATAAPAAAATNGSITVTKSFNPKGSGFDGSFEIRISCTSSPDPVTQTKTIAGPWTADQNNVKSVTFDGITTSATSTTCTIIEPSPTAPDGWGFALPVFNPSVPQQGNVPANVFVGQVTLSGANPTANVTVTNQIDNSISYTNPNNPNQSASAANNP